MITVAIVTWPYLGHIYPTLSLGANLLARGIHVVWICEVESIAHMLPKGGEFIQMARDGLLEAESMAGKPYGMKSLKDLYENILVPHNERIYNQLETISKTRKFDFIVTDQQAFSGALFAYQNGIPYATSVTAPAAIEPSIEFPEIHEYEKMQVIQYQQSHGCDINEALVWSSPTTLIYTTKLFLQKDDFPQNYYFIGPSLQKRKEWEVDISAVEKQKGKRPIVLVSMGSILPREPDFFDKIIDAFSELDITVVIVVDPNIRSTWPANFYPYLYIPQLRLLQFVDVVVCHAGHNTVCESLSAGIPMITIPVAYDQSYVATKVKNCGAGIRLKYRRLSSKGLRDALTEILQNSSYKMAAQRIQSSFQQSEGERVAADLIVKRLKDSSGIVVG